jgi:hypothetical protein
MRKMDEAAEGPRDPEAIVNAFLQHKSMEQTQDLPGAWPALRQARG